MISVSGLLVHNTEFFTFDHRHYSLKGTCGYLLAQDFVDGNFSVAVNLEGGKVKSLYVSDRDNFIEVKSDGMVSYQNILLSNSIIQVYFKS